MTYWRKRIGEEGLKTLFTETIQVALKGKAITLQEMSLIIVDATVEEKKYHVSMNTKLLYRAIAKSVRFSKRNGICLR